VQPSGLRADYPCLLVLRSVYKPLLACLAGAAVVALLIFGVIAAGSNRTLDQALADGQHPHAPEYTRELPALSGGTAASLSTYRGHVVLLNFWASWCPPCRQEAPLVEQAQRELSPHGGTVLAVSTQDVASDSESFRRQYHLSYPDLRDVTGDYVHAFGTTALPESFILDPQGRIVAISRGEINRAFVAQAVSLAHSGS
jgi:cytochrome c biogenesis protein CcmG/thiol:disulfide interchange protein DsbE